MGVYIYMYLVIVLPVSSLEYVGGSRSCSKVFFSVGWKVLLTLIGPAMLAVVVVTSTSGIIENMSLKAK